VPTPPAPADEEEFVPRVAVSVLADEVPHACAPTTQTVARAAGATIEV
jgi:hypothetical protein